MSLKVSNVYAVARPFHSASKILGLTAFNFQFDKGRFVVSSSVFNIFCVLSSTFWPIVGSSCLNAFMNSIKKRFPDFEIPSIVEKSSIVLTLVYAYCMILVNWWTFATRKYFEKILNGFNDVDEELRALNVYENFSKHRQTVVACIIIVTIPMIYHAAASFAMLLELDDIWQTIAVFGMWTYMGVVNFAILQLSYFMWQVKIRYQLINSFLSNLCVTKSFESNAEALKIVAFLHDKLVDISQMINRCYGFPALLVISTVFGYFTMNTFSMFKIWARRDNDGLFFIVNCFFWSSYYALLVYLVLHMGHFTRAEALDTANQLHKLANKSSVGFCSRSVTAFSQQILHRVPHFSCGLFSFDLHLAFKMLSAAAVYLTILFQFENSNVAIAECNSTALMDQF